MKSNRLQEIDSTRVEFKWKRGLDYWDTVFEMGFNIIP